MLQKTISNFVDFKALSQEQTAHIKGGYGGVVIIIDDIIGGGSGEPDPCDRSCEVDHL